MVAQNCHAMISTVSVPCSEVADQSTRNSVVSNCVSIEVGQALSTGPCDQDNISTELSSQQPTIIHLSLTETMIEQQANGGDQSHKKKELKHFSNSDSYDNVSLGNLSNILKQKDEVPECDKKIQEKSSCTEKLTNMYALPDPKKESICVSPDGSELNTHSLAASLSVGKNLPENHGVNGELSTYTSFLPNPWGSAKKKKIIIKQLPPLESSIETDNKMIVRKSLRRQTSKSCFIITSQSEPKTCDAGNLDISKNYLSRTLPDEENKNYDKILKSSDLGKSIVDIECVTQKSQVTTNCVFEKKQMHCPKQKAVLTVSPNKTKSTILRRKRTQGKSVKHKNKCLVKKKRKRKESMLDTVTINIPSQKPKRPKLSLGPYIHIVGTKERPLSVSVINLALTGEEMAKPRVQVANRNPNRRLHVGHVSTLSSAYDAFTKDETWLCAFCHRRSHVDDLGDLFGPYYIEDDNPKKDDDVLVDTNACNPVELNKHCRSRVKDRKNSTYSKFPGQSTSSQSPGSKQPSPSTCSAQPSGKPLSEFWVHESCAFWAHGVYLASVDQEIAGLAQAVKEAADM
ncbi:uncharacterized protein LOC106476483, partial [Limulus polyphemus]|uniref:Uncharacterized protein LOC106476483 n=1 Tax=Limulus polyphemus TaxID=6850 RepID=A0ABM1RXE2_LIMPO